MITLPTETVELYLSNLTPEQIGCIRCIRNILLECGGDLTEHIDTGKWFGGLLVYKSPSGYVQYALGPRSKGFSTFHMMPYYASKVLQDRHSQALKGLLSGKSCIKLKTKDKVPEEIIRDILSFR